MCDLPKELQLFLNIITTPCIKCSKIGLKKKFCNPYHLLNTHNIYIPKPEQLIKKCKEINKMKEKNKRKKGRSFVLKKTGVLISPFLNYIKSFLQQPT